MANNYSPSAQGLSTHIIYKRKKNSSAPPCRKTVNSKKKQEFIVKEDIKVLHNINGSHSVPAGTFSVLSEGTTSKTPGGTFTSMGFVTKGRFHHISPTRVKGTKSELDASENKEIGLDSSTLSHNKPPKLKRVQSAGQTESLVSSDVRDSGFHGDGESGSPHSKRTRVAWGSYQGAAISTNDDVLEDLETELKDVTEEATNSAPAVNDRDYDEETIAVLNIKFPPASLTPTLGLPRAVTPPESQAKRYKNITFAQLKRCTICSLGIKAVLSMNMQFSLHQCFTMTVLK